MRGMPSARRLNGLVVCECVCVCVCVCVNCVCQLYVCQLRDERGKIDPAPPLPAVLAAVAGEVDPFTLLGAPRAPQSPPLPRCGQGG